MMMTVGFAATVSIAVLIYLAGGLFLLAGQAHDEARGSGAI